MATSDRGLASMDDSTKKRVQSEGGKASHGGTNKNMSSRSEAGKKGAAAQSKADKAKGGRNSHSGGGNS